MPTPTSHPELPRLSRNYSFHFLWTSTLASGFADRLAMLAVAVMLGQGVVRGPLASERLADASIIAAINFWFFLPYVLWGPFAGWLADRLPRKWIMFVADEARGLIILFAYTLLPTGSTGAVPGLYETWQTFDLFGLTIALDHAWQVWLMMFSIGLFAATFSPARNSIVPNVVGYAVLQRANSLVIGMGVIGNLIGFAVGGPLAEQFVHLCIFGSALSYLIPGWMWPFLKTPVKRRDRTAHQHSASPLGVLREVHHGARYILQHKPILVLTIISVLFWSGSHVIMAAGSAIAVHLYGGTIADFAMIGGSFGLGMLLGALTLGVLNNRFGSEVTMIVSMVAVAVLFSLLVVVPFLWLGIGLALVMGYFGGFIMITANTLIQQLTADCYRGRVMGFKDLVSDAGGVAISFAIWRMADADRHILHMAHVFAGLLLATAAWGVWRYLLHGAAPRRVMNLLWRIDRLYATGIHHVQAAGLHHVPSNGPAILVCKHTAGVDPLLIQAMLRRPVRWMMAAEHMHAALRWFWAIIEPVGVKRDGNDRAAIRQALGALRDGDVLGIFPEGHLPEHRGQFLPFNSGVALLAARGKAPIVPVYISGTPHSRKRKVYTSFFRFSRARIIFGKPFTLADLAVDPRDHQAVADAIQQRLRDLAATTPTFR